MRIVDLAEFGKGNRKAGHWRRESEITGTHGHFRKVSIYHYGTCMLSYVESAAGPLSVDWSTGNGSVSDQQGMNQLFNALNLPYYYSRAGGAEIR